MDPRRCERQRVYQCPFAIWVQGPPVFTPEPVCSIKRIWGRGSGVRSRIRSADRQDVRLDVLGKALVDFLQSVAAIRAASLHPSKAGEGPYATDDMCESSGCPGLVVVSKRPEQCRPGEADDSQSSSNRPQSRNDEETDNVDHPPALLERSPRTRKTVNGTLR